jgi:hypothetical protein
MALRTLKRRVIIREYDFDKIKSYALSTGKYQDEYTLYDRADFFPFTRDILEKEYMLKILGDKTKKNFARPSEHPANWLYDMKDYLYSEKYIHYHPVYDEDGFIYVQARMNTPRTRIGWGIFEKDLTSRL